MRRLPFALWWPAVLAALVLTLTPQAGLAADGQKLTFESFDQVELQGTFYPSNKAGSSSACVLLLHKIGGNRQQEGWDALIEKLQGSGFSVLAFDFRGHGDSTTVKPNFFWQNQSNLRGIKGANPKKDTIAFKDFSPSYYSMLLNDIAAAKFCLEQKNNAKECNSNDVIVIGAEDGAALGMAWMATEWQRRKRILNPMTLQPQFSPEVEGKDLAAGIWLSPRQSLGSGAGAPRVPMSTVFNNQKMRELPMCFFYGDEDKVGKDTSMYLYKTVLNADKLKLKLTFEIPLKGTKLAGNELLGKSVKTEDLIAKYVVEKVMEARAAKVWSERELKLNPLQQAVPVSSVGLSSP